MPEYRTASWFEPDMAMKLPVGVPLRNTETGIATTANTIITTGMPPMLPLPRKTMLGGKPDSTPPWVRPMAMPLTIVMLPSVARMGETPK